MVKRSYRNLFGICGKWLEVFLEIFQKPGVFLKIHELRLDFEPVYGPFAKWRGFSGFRFIFQ
jgi:hypothetical protein